jgi:hypothetical protein
MSHTEIIRVTGELDKKFKPSGSSTYKETSQLTVNKEKRILLAYCMNSSKKDFTDSVWSTNKIYENIEMQLKMVQFVIHETWAINLQNLLNEETKWSKKEEIDYCGWEWAESHQGSNFETDKDIIDYFLDNIFRLVSCVDAPKYFENKETWFDYYNDISEEVDSFEELLINFYDHEFVDFYRSSSNNSDNEEDESSDGTPNVDIEDKTTIDYSGLAYDDNNVDISLIKKDNEKLKDNPDIPTNNWH